MSENNQNDNIKGTNSPVTEQNNEKKYIPYNAKEYIEHVPNIQESSLDDNSPVYPKHQYHENRQVNDVNTPNDKQSPHQPQPQPPQPPQQPQPHHQPQASQQYNPYQQQQQQNPQQPQASQQYNPYQSPQYPQTPQSPQQYPQQYNPYYMPKQNQLGLFAFIASIIIPICSIFISVAFEFDYYNRAAAFYYIIATAVPIFLAGYALGKKERKLLPITAICFSLVSALFFSVAIFY